MTTPTARVRPIAQLLTVVTASERPHDLIALGTTLHYFTDPLRATVELDPVRLHRATTVLTKQVTLVLGSERPLAALSDLVVDPHRRATPEGQTAAEFCGEAWPEIRAIATERADAALSGATTFGETAVLRLAATRAAGASMPWWGSPVWRDRVRDADAIDRRIMVRLLEEPERVPEEVLRAVLVPDDRSTGGFTSGPAERCRRGTIDDRAGARA